MKAWVILLLWLFPAVACAQPCQELKLNKKKRMVLEGFISQAGQEGLLTKEQGVVLLYHSQDSSGNERWDLTPKLQYTPRRAHWLPSRFYNLDGRIVLVFQESERRTSLSPNEKEQLLACLEPLLARKVQPEPPPDEGAWVERAKRDPLGMPVLDSLRNPVTERVFIQKPEPLRTGAAPGSRSFIFKKDGTVAKAPSPI